MLSSARSRRRHVSKSSASRPTNRDTASFDKRSAPQQRRQRSLDASRVRSAQIDAQDRFIDLCAPPLIARHQLAPPFGSSPLRRHHAGAGHRKRRRSQTRRQRPLAAPVPIPLPRHAHARRFRRSQCRFQFFFDDRIDQSARSPPNEYFQARRPARLRRFVRRTRSCYPSPSRHPPASACRRTQLQNATAPDDDALSTFPPDSRHYEVAEKRMIMRSVSVAYMGKALETRRSAFRSSRWTGANRDPLARRRLTRPSRGA